jgi:hypothetical protein
MEPQNTLASLSRDENGIVYQDFDFDLRGSRKFHKRLNVFSRLLPEMKGKKVVDLGCNNGFFSLHMARAGADVTALEGRVRLHPLLGGLAAHGPTPRRNGRS